MRETMRAARFTGAGIEPVVEIVSVPEPPPGHVRVAMRVCGICGTDLHIIEGDTKSKPPVTLGHEISGVVDAIGDGVESVVVGQRIAVNSMITCGRCLSCSAGRPYLCQAPEILGLDLDGGHADFVIAPAANCVPLPDAIDFETGALATDAIATPFQAVKRSDIEYGATVAVFGLGGLGLNAVMVLKQLYGATVIGVDASDGPLERAAAFGVDHVVDAREGHAARQIRTLVDGGVDASFDFVGDVKVVEQGLRALRPGGTCIVVGVISDHLSLGLRQETLVGQQLTLRGSFGFRSNDDVVEILDLVSTGRLDVTGIVTDRFSLDDYAEGLAALRGRSAETVRVVMTT